MLGLTSVKPSAPDEEAVPLIRESSYSLDENEKPEEINQKSIPAKWHETSLSQPRKKWLQYLITLATLFIPSFVLKILLPETAARILPPPSKIHRTSWLDGLRGLACLGVVAYHIAGGIFGNGDVGYGAPSNGTSVFQLPGIRLLFAGPANVMVFFVISGYALSIKPVELMGKPDANGNKAMSSFSSSVFRRFFRLYLPAWASTIFMLLWDFFRLSATTNFWTVRSYINWFAYNKMMRSQARGSSGAGHPLESRGTATLPGPSLAHWFSEMFRMVSVLEGSTPEKQLSNSYNPPTWTIPVEYRASLLLFLVQLALFHLKPSSRILITGLLMVYCIFADRFEMILFLGGFFIAQIDPYIRDWEEVAYRIRTRQIVWKILFSCVFAVGIWWASVPGWQPGATVPYMGLAKLIPSFWSRKEYFWTGLGALLIVFSISRLEWICRFLSTPVIQYFGKISFAVYLIHSPFGGPTGFLVLYHLSAWFQNLDRHNPFVFGCTFAFALACTYGVVFWWADLFWRYVDIPSVKFARWLETKLGRGTSTMTAR